MTPRFWENRGNIAKNQPIPLRRLIFCYFALLLGDPNPGEIKKGTGGRGRDRKCHKLSWRLSHIVVTFYDDLWRFMTFYDVLCQWNKETEIVIKCRKLSWHVVNCRDVCRKYCRDIFFPVPFPPFPFGFRRKSIFLLFNLRPDIGSLAGQCYFQYHSFRNHCILPLRSKASQN